MERVVERELRAPPLVLRQRRPLGRRIHRARLRWQRSAILPHTARTCGAPRLPPEDSRALMRIRNLSLGRFVAFTARAARSISELNDDVSRSCASDDDCVYLFVCVRV